MTSQDFSDLLHHHSLKIPSHQAEMACPNRSGRGRLLCWKIIPFIWKAFSKAISPKKKRQGL